MLNTFFSLRPSQLKENLASAQLHALHLAYFAEIGGSTNVSVQLVRVSDSAVVWAYQVKKGNEGSHRVQSMSEAVTKHLKDEFFKNK